MTRVNRESWVILRKGRVSKQSRKEKQEMIQPDN
jgi:hypothetical protein